MMSRFISVLLLLILSACAAPAAEPSPFPPGSPEGRGKALFSGKGRCASCHALSPDKIIVGPSLAGIGVTAEKRAPSLTAAEYLEESILDPNKVKTPGFEAFQMDLTLAKQLTVDEIADIVAYLLTLK
jgi:mono/diheme cytochrome c family protein